MVTVETSAISVVTKPNILGEKTATVAFIKRAEAPLDAARPLTAQLQVCSFLPFTNMGL